LAAPSRISGNSLQSLPIPAPFLPRFPGISAKPRPIPGGFSPFPRNSRPFPGILPLQEHKSRVNSLESAVSQAKLRYSVALRNLEQISEELHARRFQRILRKRRRENPLGAEGGPGSAGIAAIPEVWDSQSVPSLRSSASELPKLDSLEPLGAGAAGIPGIPGIPGTELGEGRRRQRRSLSV
ncbi:3BP5L protein, partial [Ifrita kowaldi]|nr:3BP5L protein [Ifrita kowaldi]